MTWLSLKAESTEGAVVDSIPRIQPLTIKTPIVEIEADYGNPLIDGTVILLILGFLYVFKKMIDKIKSNDICNNLINGIHVDYEEPMIKDLFGKLWKGKADIVNHDEELIIDLKTTGDISRFRSSAFKFGYDSQAYIYKKLFGYDFMFIAIDKTSHQIGIFDCSRDFYLSGEDKVERAVQAYELFYNTEGFDPKQYFLQETL